MAEDLQAIRRFVDALVRRERQLLAGQALARGLMLFALVVLVSILAARGHWNRATSLMWLVGGTGVLAWLAVALPLLRWWVPSADRLRQARQVEDLRPALRGRLVTSVAHEEGVTGQESPALLGLVARRALASIQGVAVGHVHPSGHVIRAVMLALLLWLVALPATWLTPGGPVGLLRFWASGLDARAAAITQLVQREESEARVGDLVLRYTYPDYTGLDPREVANTTGDVQGPPGTWVEVLARTGDPVEAAGLVAYDQTFDASVSDDRRSVSGRFRISGDEGAWRLMLYRGGEPERSRDFTITPSDDLPPEVLLQAERPVLEVAADQSFALNWQARDDYGIRRTVLKIGPDNSRTLYEMTQRKAEVLGSLTVTPVELGLAPGDEVDLIVSAWDNDTVGGSKEGMSAPVKVVVLGPNGLDRRRAERQAELEKLLVPVLAKMLTEEWPPATTGGDMVRWGEVVAGRYETLQLVVEADWANLPDDALDLSFVRAVLSTGRDLVRYTQVAFQPRSDQRPPVAEVDRVGEMHANAVVALERALLAFLKVRQMKSQAEVWEKAQELRNATELLRQTLAQETPDTMEMLARLDLMERLLAQMMTLSEAMADGGLKSFVNQREHELNGLMQEIREALAEGRIDDAKRLMERLAAQIDELAGGIENDLEQRQAQMSESQGDAGELLKELAALEGEQRGLQDEVRALREDQDGQASEQAAVIWQRIETLTGEAITGGEAYRLGLEKAKRPFYERERAGGGVESVENLQGAVHARDVRGSADEVVTAIREWLTVQRTGAGLMDRGVDKGPRPEQVNRVIGALEQIARLLDQLERSAGQLDEGQSQHSQQLQDRQHDLENRLEQAQQQAEQVASQLPVDPEGMSEMLEEAQQRMQNAGEDLGQGRPMAAEGSQGVAAERIRRARSALQQAMNQSQQMQNSGRPGSQGEGEGQQSSGEPEGDGDQHSRSQREVYIPGREAYETPEDYRRALLEGMEGEVPDAYRAWKKRYYEELVQQ
jgi:hypothetical protein